jgi:hypothetical protein
MLPWPARADGGLHLLPGSDRGPVQVSVGLGRNTSTLSFRGPAGEDYAPITLPGGSVSLVGRLPLAGRDMLLASLPADAFVTLLVIIGWDGQRPRILDLEAAQVTAPEGPLLTMRLSSTPDGQILRLIWQLSAPRGPTLPFHDQWIDMLGFRPQAPLADVAPRRPMPGGCQDRLATIRANVAEMLRLCPDRVTLPGLNASGLLDIPHQLALATGAAAYPAGMADP